MTSLFTVTVLMPHVPISPSAAPSFPSTWLSVHRYEDFVEALGKVMKDFALEGGAVDERPSAIRYRKWVEDMGGVLSGKGVDLNQEDASNQHLPLELLDPSDERLVKPLFTLLRTSASFIHWYLEEIILPTFMRFQEHKLSSSGQDMGGNMLFKRRIGFSGERLPERPLTGRLSSGCHLKTICPLPIPRHALRAAAERPW